MLRLITCLLAIVAFSGCRAPVPSFNPLAPYGPARVPPPSTGSYGSPNTYYEPGSGGTTLSPAPMGTGFRATSTTAAPQTMTVAGQPSQNSSTGTTLTANPTLTANQDGKTGLVPTTTVTQNNGTVQFTTPANSPANSAANSLASRLRGMPINDATVMQVPGEPAQFTPPTGMIDISQLPDARVTAPPPVNNQPTLATPPVIGTSATADSSTGTVTTAGWQTR